MLKIVTVTLCSLALVATLHWEDCGDENKAITISDFIAPTHISFPGLVHYTLNLTFIREIRQLYVDIDLVRYFLGFPLSLPCKSGTIVGTCTDIDACWLLDRAANYMPGHLDSYGHKMQTIINNSIGHYLKCPIQRGNIPVKDQVLELAEIPWSVHLLADGDYTIRVIAREEKGKAGDIIGCVEVNATIGGQDNFGPASLVG